MGWLRAGLAFGAAAALSTAVGCTSKKTGGSGGSVTSTASSASSSGAGTGGDPTVAECETCLDMKCSIEKAACDADCYAIQGCIDAVCFNLSATGSADEGACQVYCQGQHPAGKANHLAYVNCAAYEPSTPDAGVSCSPPCAGAPYDYEQCVADSSAGSCKAASDACAASSDCTAYQACASACTTFSACEACASSASGMAGEQLFEALQLCLAHHCLAEEWLPHF
jgi:hypothetical protein